jgi:hypothetical protein
MTEKRKTKRKKYINKKNNKTKKTNCVYNDEAIRIQKLIKKVIREKNRVKKQENNNKK